MSTILNEECCNCGQLFEKNKSGKSYKRKSIGSNFKLKEDTITYKKAVEDVLSVELTPKIEGVKSTRFLCHTCAWNIESVAKSRETKVSALKSLKESGGQCGYLSSKIRSPFASPRKKWPRLAPPETNETVQSKTKLKYCPRKKMPKTESEIERGCKYLKARQYKYALNILFRASDGFKKAVIQYLKTEINREVKNVKKTEIKSLQGGKTLTEIKKFDWKLRYDELKEKCPILMSTLDAALTNTHGVYNPLRAHCIPIQISATLMSIIMYQRKPKLFYDFQEMNSLQMWMAGCKREMFARFSHLGLCVGIFATRSSIDRIRRNYDSKIMEWKRIVTDYLLELPIASETTPVVDDLQSASSDSVHTPISSSNEEAEPMELSPSPQVKLSDILENTNVQKTIADGKFGYSICFDNVNHKVSVRHQSRDKNNKIFNMVQAYGARDRISSVHLSDVQPTHEDILNIPIHKFLPSDENEVLLKSEMKAMVTRVLVKYIPMFHDLDNEIKKHIPHQYASQSSAKSVLIPLGVIDKDESKVSDTIDILDEYHKYLPFKPDGDPLTLPLHADGLSCERGNDAQCARINATSPWKQLQGFTMNIQEWHKRCLLLQDIYDDLFNGSSGREKGTLFHLKNYFNHRSVSSNVKDAFNYDEEFLEFCCDGYLVLAAMHYMDTEELETLPDNFPTSKDEKLQFLYSLVSKIIEMIYVSSQPIVKKIIEDMDDVSAIDVHVYDYCICKMDIPGSKMIFCENRNCERGIWFHYECVAVDEDNVPEGLWFCSPACTIQKAKRKSKKKKSVADSFLDRKKLYTLKVIWAGLNQKIRKDAIRENDGERIILHWKMDLLQFFEKHHPKYFLIAYRLLASINGAVSTRLQHTLKWNRCVNVTGGAGNNIAMDLQMEFYNKAYKESVKDAGGKLTPDTVARHSQMVGVGKVLGTVYEKQISELKRATGKSKKIVSQETDIFEFVQLLKCEKLFDDVPGRYHHSFPDIVLSLYPNVSPKAVRKRLDRLQKDMSKKRQVTLQMQKD